MKKITDFIIDKRYIVLGLFIILTIISFFLSTKVKINHDISLYLPSSSETRIGKEIMEKEFSSSTSTLNIMLENLTKKEKEDAYNYLKNLKHISSVDYDDSKNYNKGKYTLYTTQIDDTADSYVTSKVYKKIENHFKDSLCDTSGDASEYNKPVLPFYIIVLAVTVAVVILIIMCESFIEPFLFLTSILIAVVLNNGSNIMFESVSNITSSICAILQMALSMDYSIMLMNRYRQERKNEKDKVIAMKKALFNAFSSISSSSITTIVGLLALVFMSFTLGRDLGFVLAKGVLFSLLSIFTCLPCLILMSDSLINKTKKKSPVFKLNLIGKIAYNLRYPALIIFIIVFIGSYFFQGNLKVTYTQSGNDKIDKIFKLNNQMAIIYPNKYENHIKDYCKSLEGKDKIDNVLCYSNTINLPLTYNKLNNKLSSLGSDVDIDNYLLKIIYYHYYNKETSNKMTLNELITFIKSEVYKNKEMSKNLDTETKDNIERLIKFTNPQEINKKRNIDEISNTLNIESDKVSDLLIYSNSKNTTTKMTISEFVSFMKNNVLRNSKYSSSIDNETKNNLNKISKFINKNTINNKLTEKEISNLFGIDETMTKSLYTYYKSTKEIEEKLSIEEFLNFISDNVLTDPTYSNLFDDNTKASINTLKTFSNTTIINKSMSYIEISNILNLNPEDVYKIFYIVFAPTGLDDDNWLLSPYEFVNIILTNDNIKNSLDSKTIMSLEKLNFIMTSTTNNTKYSYKEMSNYLTIDQNTVKNIYSLYLSDNITLSPYEFVDFVLTHQNDESLKGNIKKESITELTLLKNIMDSVLINKTYSKEELSAFLNIDYNKLSLLYSLYDKEIKNSEVLISFKDFISFLLNDVVNNEEYRSSFTLDTKNKLTVINDIINDSLNNKKYNKEKTYNTLSKLSNDLDKKLIDLVYIYYGSINNYNDKYKMTIEQFVKFLNNDILNDERFNDYIDKDKKENIISSKDLIKTAKKLLVGKNYSRIVINTKLSPESKETFKFIQNLKDKAKKNNDKIYIIGDSPMAYEMSNTFKDELNLITILTMIFIFVVVVITFKSLLIPIILVILIQSAVYLTMGILSLSGSVYFISILIVQSILMGATIDYAILYTSYYIESRKSMTKIKSIINSYNNSMHTILTSASILIIVTLIVGIFASAVTAKICKIISQGCLCSVLLILILLPAVLASVDKIIIKKNK